MVSGGSQIRVRGSGTARRALVEPSLASSLAEDEPVESGNLEEIALEAEETNEVELSEEGGVNGAISPAALQKEVARRRNFAIISHPDAGKTTLVNNWDWLMRFRTFVCRIIWYLAIFGVQFCRESAD